MSIVLDGSNLTTTGVINSGTAIATTSGTYKDFTGIPAGTKRITVMFSGVSFSTVVGYGIVQIGAGSITSSGYANTEVTTFAGGNPAPLGFTTGFAFSNLGNAADTVNGTMTLVTLGSNIWVASGVFTNTNTLRALVTAGNITLGGSLDRIRITTSATDTFDAGSINILYE